MPFYYRLEEQMQVCYISEQVFVLPVKRTALMMPVSLGSNPYSRSGLQFAANTDKMQL